MKSQKKFFCISAVVFLLGQTSLFGAEQSARDVLNKAYNYIGSMDRYAFNAIIEEDITNSKDGTTRLRQDVSVKIDRPGNLRVDTKGDIKNRSSYIHNGNFTMIDHDLGYYAQLQTPKTIDGALDFIFEKYGINAPLASLMYSDMHKRTQFTKSKNFGKMTVDGTECDYVAFSNDTMDIHVWITIGDKPLVKIYSIIDKIDKKTSRRNTTLTWNINAHTPERDFIFTAPKDAVKISVETAN